MTRNTDILESGPNNTCECVSNKLLTFSHCLYYIPVIDDVTGLRYYGYSNFSAKTNNVEMSASSFETFTNTTGMLSKISLLFVICLVCLKIWKLTHTHTHSVQVLRL